MGIFLLTHALSAKLTVRGYRHPMSADVQRGFDAAPPRAEDLLRAAAGAPAGAQARIAAARAGLFVPDTQQLSDYQRAGMRLLLDRLVGAIEDELRRALLADPRLPESAAHILASERILIAAPLLLRAGLLEDGELIAVLLARSDEQRIFAAARTQRAAESAPLRAIEGLLADTDIALSQAAMAVLVAESRRFDALDAALLPRTDLPAELQYRMVWRIAAALRHWLVARQEIPAAEADALLERAVRAPLSGHDEGETLESTALQLAAALSARSRLDDALLTAAAAEGRLMLFLALFAVRSGLDFTSARALVLAPGMRQRVVMLAALGLKRTDAAAILLALNAGQRDDEEIADDLTDYDALDRDLAAEAIRPWQLDPGYRDALTALAAAEGRGA